METMPSAFEIEETPQKHEVNLEKEATMDEFRMKRSGILQKIMSRKGVEAALLLAPGLDVVALTTFAARGETLAGKELSGRSRMNYAAIAGFLGIFYTLQLSGMHKEALAARGVAATLSAMEFGPEVIEKANELAEERLPVLKEFVQRTGAFISDKFPLIENVRSSMIDFANSNPDLIALNIDG